MLDQHRVSSCAVIASLVAENPALYGTYVFSWVCFCLVALGIMYHDRVRLRSEGRDYLRFLLMPWKLAIFVPAFLFVTFAGHYTDDETWDIVTGSGMSFLTFLTAPWALGIYNQVVMRRRPKRYLIVAAALCLFSCSWFYDGYLLLRDGAYTVRWLGNLLLSPLVYLAAGYLWNLEAAPGRLGFAFSYSRRDWPCPPIDTRVRPFVFVIIPLILVAAFVLVAYVGWNFK